MNLIDIAIAQSSSPQGQLSSYITQAQQAAKSATEAANVATILNEEISTALERLELNLGTENSGKIVIVDPNGSPTAGSLKEQELIQTLEQIAPNTIDNEGTTLGLEIDYENKSFARLQEEENFNQYQMYGGRMRCNVNDNGEITAFYGDINYKDDGSNGQVMVYQPKFYYKRTPIKLKDNIVIQKESISISTSSRNEFKLHPLFINKDGEELDYVLLPAYQGSLYDVSLSSYSNDPAIEIDFSADKLSSIAGAKPVSGQTSQMTHIAAEQLAQNRGQGWHITNLALESANQMLFMIEYGQMNSQSAIGSGVTKIQAISNVNTSSLTGSTAALGNESGVAQSTINESNGVMQVLTDNNYKSISYRGMENPWGNIWHFIGDVAVYGEGNSNGGYVYLCNGYDYKINSIENYENTGIKLPSTSSWVSAMAYGDEKYDWIYMPAESRGASSALPVGDNLWVVSSLNNINNVIFGGSSSSGESAGMFYYGCDVISGKYNCVYGANIMFIPTKNAIYNANIIKWQKKYRGE